MENSGGSRYYINPQPLTTPHQISLDQVVRQVRASIMPEVEEKVDGAVRRQYDGIISRVECVERRQTEQERDINAWKAKTEEIDTKINEVLLKYNWSMDRIGIVVNLTDRVTDDIASLKSRMDALDNSGQVGPWIPMSPISNPRSPRPATPHGAGVSGTRIQLTSDVQKGSGQPGTTISPTSMPQESPAIRSAAAAAPFATHILETRPGYARCPFCHKELKKRYMMGQHRQKHCKKSPDYIIRSRIG